MSVSLRKLDLGDMDQAAHVLRLAFNERLPWIADLHTNEEDRAYFRGRVFAACTIWGALDGDDLVGFIAVRDGWIDHLYVLPVWQRQGLGSSLLAVAKAGGGVFRLWTFQRNNGARRFYEAHGFVAEEETDGSGNDEREPDVLYKWSGEAPRRG